MHWREASAIKSDNMNNTASEDVIVSSYYSLIGTGFLLAPKSVTLNDLEQCNHCWRMLSLRAELLFLYIVIVSEGSFCGKWSIFCMLWLWSFRYGRGLKQRIHICHLYVSSVPLLEACGVILIQLISSIITTSSLGKRLVASWLQLRNSKIYMHTCTRPFSVLPALANKLKEILEGCWNIFCQLGGCFSWYHTSSVEVIITVTTSALRVQISANVNLVRISMIRSLQIRISSKI